MQPSLSDGLRLMDNGDLLAALPHLVDALRMDDRDPQRVRTHRLRLASILQQSPKPVLAWHDDRTIAYAELSPDARRLALAGEDGRVRLWDVATGEQLVSISAHGDTVRVASFSIDSRMLLTASRDGRARIWDVSTGKPLTPPLSHARTARIWSIADPRQHCVRFRIVGECFLGTDELQRAADAAGDVGEMAERCREVAFVDVAMMSPFCWSESPPKLSASDRRVRPRLPGFGEGPLFPFA